MAENVMDSLTDEDIRIMKTAAYIEGKGYMKLCRIEEVIKFAEMMNYRKIGIAFCIGLKNEAKTIHKILENKFDVVSVCCKICGIDKKELSFQQIDDGRYEATCNPVGQAMLLNRCNTDLNITVGLCIGHDILFNRHSDAPVTALIVKDRPLGHNPAAAIYSNYHLKRLLTPKFDVKI